MPTPGSIPFSPSSVRCVVPKESPYNSIYLQAIAYLKALATQIHFTPEVASSRRAVFGRRRALTLYHYGSFDIFASWLAYRGQSVFVFHNVTDATFFWRWSVLVAIRALAASVQLSLFPKTVSWLTVSQFNCDVLRGKGFHDVTVVPCVIPPQICAAKTQHPSLLFIGRIAPNKNVLGLLDGYVQMASAWKGEPPSLLIVGARKTRCRYADAFEERYEAVRRVFPVIWRKDPLPYEDLQRLYASSWVYVSASRHEGFAVPVMEAITAGTPALYLSCGGTESVLKGIGCIQSPGSFAEHVKLHLVDRVKRTSLLEAQQTFTREFTVSKVGATLVAALGSLAKTKALGIELPDVNKSIWLKS